MSRARPSAPAIPEEPKSAKRLRAVGLSIDEFAARKPRKRWPGEADVRAEMEGMAKSGDWDDATGSHLVCLYEFLHREVYGVPADVVDRKTRAFATAAAGRLIAKDFGADAGEAVRFMKWVWMREAEREAWRRANHRDGQRVGWRLQFCFASLVADYRLHVARQVEL